MLARAADAMAGPGDHEASGAFPVMVVPMSRWPQTQAKLRGIQMTASADVDGDLMILEGERDVVRLEQVIAQRNPRCIVLRATKPDTRDSRVAVAFIREDVYPTEGELSGVGYLTTNPHGLGAAFLDSLGLQSSSATSDTGRGTGSGT